MGGAAGATKLTSKNSIVLPFATKSFEEFAGTNCGATAAITKQLPAGSTAIHVTEPKVGSRDSGGGTRVTGVAVGGSAVTLTILADGPSICDPAQTGVPPGEPVKWTARYTFRAEYKRRVQPVIRVFYESYVFGAKWKAKPKVIQDARRGARYVDRFTGLRWKHFGTKKATGYGRLRLNYCRRGDACPLNGKRIRIVASKPRFCKDSGKVEYLNLDTFIGRQQQAGYTIRCD